MAALQQATRTVPIVFVQIADPVGSGLVESSGAAGRQRNQFGCVFVSVVDIACGPASVDPHVAAIGPAQLLQTLHERRDSSLRFQIVCGQRHEHADMPHGLVLLRACGERPRCCRAGNCCDEIAPSHEGAPNRRTHTLPHRKEAVVHHSKLGCATSVVGHWRPSHFVPVLNNVRYASDSDHSRYESELTLWATSGLMRCSKQRLYSITSSAAMSMVFGTTKPSALAVLRLITSSNLVGACSGRSAGFSPLRMRSMYPAAWRNSSAKSPP